MSKPLLAALGILVLVAAAMLVIARWIEPAPAPPTRSMARPPPQPEQMPEEPPAPPVAGAPLTTAGGAGDQSAPPPADGAESVWRPESAATTGPWETIVPVNSFASLGKIGPGLRTALYEHSDDLLAQCSGGRNDLEPPQEEEGVVPEDTTPVLLLQLEALQGAVEIMGATVERRGGASQQLLACALAGLRGAVLTVPEARSGARHVLRFRLAQTAIPRAGR